MRISLQTLRYRPILRNLQILYQVHLSQMNSQREIQRNPENHKKICLKRPETVGMDILNTLEERNAMTGTTLITMDVPTTAKKRMNQSDLLLSYIKYY